jgi:cytochrome oxidase Cu insertion factor (SCO1/SenC/PrrC family)
MASATLRSAETTLFIARNGSYSVVPPTPAPRFALVDQHLVATTFPATGPYQILTFLDPNCNTDCRLMALQLKQLDRTLSPAERARVRYVAVAADPLHQSVADVRGFIERYRLGSMHDFHFVTGPYAKVQSVWRDYGIDVSISPGQVMSVHTDVVYVIDPRGRIRVIVGDDPPEGTAGRDSAVTTLTQALHDAGLR